MINLRVLVRDRVSTSLGLSQQRYGEGSVNIFLEDINDHDPVFIGLPYHTIFCVKENLHLPEHSRLIADLTSPSHILSQLHQACQSNNFKVCFHFPYSANSFSLDDISWYDRIFLF